MPVRRLHGAWWVDLRYNRRRYRLKSPTDTKVGAEQYEATLRSALARGEDILAPRTREPTPTFSAFSERWMKTYVKAVNKPSEQANKRSVLRAHLLPAFGRKSLDAIFPEAIESFKKAKLAARLDPKTINNALGVLRKCLNTANEWGLAPPPPRIRALKSSLPEVRYLSPEEADMLLAATPPGLWRTMVLVALHTGMRFSELVGLRWQDIDLKARRIAVQRANVHGHEGTPKNGKARHIPLTADAMDALRDLPREGEHVFSREGRWIRHEAARKRLHRACRAAGIVPVGWHGLRHTFASQLVARRAPLKAVQDLLGHGTLAMTMRYSHLDDSALRAAVSLLENDAPIREDATDGQPVGNASPFGQRKALG